jgi:hypothetical protein
MIVKILILSFLYEAFLYSVPVFLDSVTHVAVHARSGAGAGGGSH